MWNVLTAGEFDAWFAALNESALTEIALKVRLLKVYGPSLRRPHADTLRGSKHPNMRELRVDAPGSVLRIAFAFDPQRAAILLCAGDKSGSGQRRFYSQLVGRADRLYDRHLKGLRAGGGDKEK